MKLIETLDLVLKGKWYDMIESGEKPEEYRELTSYWTHRIYYHLHTLKTVRFHRGYTNKTMTFQIESIRIGKGNPEWGAPTDRKVFIVKLGERI